MVFRVMTVCLGNVCRSPVAERLLATRLASLVGDGQVEVTSAGVLGLVGRPMDPQALTQLAGLGGAGADFRSRSADPREVAAAGLVLTATADIRRQLLEEAPGAMRRVFTWKEFAVLVDGRSASSPQALVADAAARRSEVAGLALDTDDPIGRSPETHARVAREIDQAVSTIASALAASVVSSQS